MNTSPNKACAIYESPNKAYDLYSSLHRACAMNISPNKACAIYESSNKPYALYSSLHRACAINIISPYKAWAIFTLPNRTCARPILNIRVTLKTSYDVASFITV